MSIRVVKWSDEMSVGVRAFDRDHRGLVELLNEIAYAIDAEASPAAVAELITRLADETTAHFAREEGFLRGTGFPGLDRHAAEHRRLLGEIRATATQVAAGDVAEDEELHRFLHNWLIDHVVAFDKEYVPWARKTP